MAFNAHKEQPFEPGALGFSPPDIGCPLRIGKLRCAVHGEERAVHDANVARVHEKWDERADVCYVVRLAVALFKQHLIVEPVPAARPILIRPAKTKRKIRLAALQDFIYWSFEYLPAIEPIVVVTKTVDSVLGCQLRLGCPRLRQSQVVETQVRWQVRLVVPREPWLRPRHAAPFGKAFPPPLVIFRNRMKLRQVKGYRPHNTFADAIPSIESSFAIRRR